jgi:hypothetical protein
MEGNEYYADSWDAVTVTAATLNDEDVLASLGTTDSKTYILTLSEAPIGEHTFSITGEDASGNEVTITRDFEITEPEKVEIQLKPGWNFMSLPGEPLVNDTEVIFADITTVTKIRTYNNEAAKWRGYAYKDGAWTRELGFQGLSQMYAGIGYWVYSTGWETLEVTLKERSALDPLPTYVIK